MTEEFFEGEKTPVPAGKILTKNALEALTFEEALKRLEQSVTALERGDLSLERAVQVFEEGDLLRQHCEQKLSEAKMKIEKVVRQAENGAIECAALEEV